MFNFWPVKQLQLHINQIFSWHFQHLTVTNFCCLNYCFIIKSCPSPSNKEKNDNFPACSSVIFVSREIIFPSSARPADDLYFINITSQVFITRLSGSIMLRRKKYEKLSVSPLSYSLSDLQITNILATPWFLGATFENRNGHWLLSRYYFPWRRLTFRRHQLSGWEYIMCCHSAGRYQYQLLQIPCILWWV